MHASYLAGWLAFPDLATHEPIDDPDELWQRWIPSAYGVGDNVFDAVMEICAVEEFWIRWFEQWGMDNAHKRMSKVGSDVGRSLGGLAGVGISLAFAQSVHATEHASQHR